jgi:hypothetical protein
MGVQVITSVEDLRRKEQSYAVVLACRSPEDWCRM